MPASGVKLKADSAGAYRLLFILTTDKLSLNYRQINNLRRLFAGIYFLPFYSDINFGGLKSPLTLTRPDR